MFLILKVEDAIELGVATITLSKINFKRRVTSKMQFRKLILKLEDKFPLEGESDAVIYNTLYTL